jgi:hypothetical protein
MWLAFVIVAALAQWIVVWALGAKAIDSFLISIVIILVGATVAMLAPYAPGNRRR